MFNRSKVAAFAAALSLTVSVLAASPAMAARGHGGATTTAPHGACGVTADAVGGRYTISGSGFTPGELLAVNVAFSGSLVVLWPPVAADGTFSVSSYAGAAGGATANVYDNGGRSQVFLTSCSFQVS